MNTPAQQDPFSAAGYTCVCANCGAHFINANKRAVTCRDCVGLNAPSHPQPYLSAGSNRGHTTHAIKPGQRMSVCGQDGIRPTSDAFDPECAYACARCIALTSVVAPSNSQPCACPAYTDLKTGHVARFHVPKCEVAPSHPQPEGEAASCPTRNVLETWCEPLGLTKGMPLHDLAYCVASRLGAKADAEKQRADWNLSKRDHAEKIVSTLTAERDAARSRVEGLEDQVAKLRDNCKDLQTRGNSLLKQREELRAEIGAITAQRDEAIAQRDHWKANHDRMAEVKRAVLERPDLAERAALVQKLVAERDQALAQCASASLAEDNTNQENAKLRARCEGVELEGRKLVREVEILRLYGNKDCTAMADARLRDDALPPSPADGGKS